MQSTYSTQLNTFLLTLINVNFGSSSFPRVSSFFQHIMLIPDLTNLTKNQTNLQTRVDRVQKMLSKLASLRSTKNTIFPEYPKTPIISKNTEYPKTPVFSKNKGDLPVYYKKLKKNRRFRCQLSLKTEG